MKGQKIIHEGFLTLYEGLEIPCFVLENGTRVLSGRGFQEAMKIRDKPLEGEKRGGYILPTFLDAKAINPYIIKKLGVAKLEPMVCHRGNQKIHGYEATILADVCDAILEARKNGEKMTERQQIVADQCEILMRSFAKVGIIALIDEATGYQYERERFELQKILKAYINEELLPWQKRFPDEFYKEIFKLNGWGHFMTGNIDIQNRPGVIGTWTKKYIYNQLPKGVLEHLIKNTPRNEKGLTKHRFHQLLTNDIGHPHLQNQLTSVITIMKLSNNWKDFERKFNELYGQKQIQFPEAEVMEITEPKKKEVKLSDFNQKLKKGLEFNPKEK